MALVSGIVEELGLLSLSVMVNHRLSQRVRGVTFSMLKSLQNERSRESGNKWIVQVLPRLERGINLVELPAKLPVFQLFVGSELLEGEECIWVDSEDYASTYEMANQGGSRILDQIKVSRNYTPFQHFQAVKKLEEELTDNTEILVVPSINLLYEDGQLRDKEREDLFKETIRRIERYTEEYDLKALISLKKPSKVSFLVEEILDQKISVEETDIGLKFHSNDFESRIFNDNQGIQTTVPLYAEKSGINMVSTEVTKIGQDEQDLSPALGKVLQKT